MSADSLSLFMTGLKVLVLLAFIAIPWSDGVRRKLVVAAALVGLGFFLANYIYAGYRQQDLSLSVDLASVIIAQAVGGYLISYLVEMLIRHFLLRGRDD